MTGAVVVALDVSEPVASTIARLTARLTSSGSTADPPKVGCRVRVAVGGPITRLTVPMNLNRTRR